MKFESEETLLDRVKIDVKPSSMAKIGFDYTNEHPDKFVTRLRAISEEGRTYVEIYGYDIEENKRFWNSLPSSAFEKIKATDVNEKRGNI